MMLSAESIVGNDPPGVCGTGPSRGGSLPESEVCAVLDTKAVQHAKLDAGNREEVRRGDDFLMVAPKGHRLPFP